MAAIDPTKTEKILKKTLARGFVGAKADGAVKEQIQLIVFGLEDEEYAVEISEVREILRMVEIVPIPNSPSFISGIINVRGKIVVVTDLRKRFNLESAGEDQSQHIILAEIEENIYGAIVDQVDEVLRLPKDVVQEAPAIISQKINSDYVRGIVPVDDRLIILLDFSKVFSEKGLSELGEMLQKQANEQRDVLAHEKPLVKQPTEAEKAEELEEKMEEHFKEGKDSQKKEAPVVSADSTANSSDLKTEQPAEEPFADNELDKNSEPTVEKAAVTANVKSGEKKKVDIDTEKSEDGEEDTAV